MKKIMAYGKHKTSSILYLVVCLILFNALFILGCGLETFYFISAPTLPSGFSAPSIQSELINKTFKFHTNEVYDSTKAFTFMGTDVYYKIYSSEDDMRREVDSLNSTIKDSADNHNSLAADKLIQKDGYGFGYSPLHIKEGDKSHVPLTIPRDGEFDVEFRVNDLGIPGHNNHIKIGQTELKDTVIVRSTGKSFDFNRAYKPDMKADKDTYKKEQETKGSVYYVPFFAVSKGRDVNYTPYYSNVLYLGAIKIDSSNTVN